MSFWLDAMELWIINLCEDFHRKLQKTRDRLFFLFFWKTNFFRGAREEGLWILEIQNENRSETIKITDKVQPKLFRGFCLENLSMKIGKFWWLSATKSRNRRFNIRQHFNQKVFRFLQSFGKQKLWRKLNFTSDLTKISTKLKHKLCCSYQKLFLAVDRKKKYKFSCYVLIARLTGGCEHKTCHNFSVFLCCDRFWKLDKLLELFWKAFWHKNKSKLMKLWITSRICSIFCSVSKFFCFRFIKILNFCDFKLKIRETC